MIKLLNKELVRVGSKSETKNEILQEIADLVSNCDKTLESKTIYKALQDREKLSSTGLGSGLAIPHCAFEKLDKFYVGLIFKPNGIDFDSIDGALADLIFFSVGPKNMESQHISTLTSISKLSTDKELLNKIKASKTTDELYSLIHRDEYDESEKEIKCQFVIHVQEETLFQEVLEILASDVEGAISVINADTAGTYLHKLPLFSSFWNDVSDRFSKIIVAVIDKRLMNETIRRINMVKGDRNQGLMITVNELLYFDGSLDY